MDVTDFIASHREKSLASGDYAIYKKRLGRELLSLRRKLCCTVPSDKKTGPTRIAPAKHIETNNESIRISLLTSERAWADALVVKTAHAAGSLNQKVPSSARRHIISRLHKASSTAKQLARSLDHQSFPASTNDVLEVRAYCLSLLGVLAFEKDRWNDCLQHFAGAYLIYETVRKLRTSSVDLASREMLRAYIEPGLRVAAYKSKISRSALSQTIAAEHVSSEDRKLIEETSKGPLALSDLNAKSNQHVAAFDQTKAPSDFKWRSKIIKLEDAMVASALEAVHTAAERLASRFSNVLHLSLSGKAALYDEVLIATQDAVDATKSSLDDLAHDGLPSGHPRLQALEIIRTAMQFTLISWRIGRNRVLCGDFDGVSLSLASSSQSTWNSGSKSTHDYKQSKGHIVKTMKENIVLYDSILQSLDSVQNLAGFTSEHDLAIEVDQRRAYFQSIRCLATACFHKLLGNQRFGLALLSRAERHCLRAKSGRESDSEFSGDRPPDLSVSQAQLKKLEEILQSLMVEEQALAVLDVAPSTLENSRHATMPLSARLEACDFSQVNLFEIVGSPSKVNPIPEKPIFLDIAYNYIEFIGQSEQSQSSSAASTQSMGSRDIQSARRTWFGFGR